MNEKLEAQLKGNYTISDAQGFEIGGSPATFTKPGYQGYPISSGRIVIPDDVTEFIIEQEKNIDTLKAESIANSRYPLSEGKALNSAYYKIGKAATKYYQSKYGK
jgi:hypothetical protein